MHMENQNRQMALRENELYWRIYLLLDEGVPLVSKLVISRELTRHGSDIDSLLLQSKDQLKKNYRLNESEIEVLYPADGNTNIDKWNSNMFTSVILTIFRTSLLQNERKQIRNIHSIQKELCTSQDEFALDDETFDDHKTTLEDTLSALAFDEKVKSEIDDLINIYTIRPLNAADVLQHIEDISLSEGTRQQLEIFLHSLPPAIEDDDDKTSVDVYEDKSNDTGTSTNILEKSKQEASSVPPSKDYEDHMITKEDEYFLRASILLLKGGRLMSKETLYKELRKTGANLDVLLKKHERKFKRKFVKKQREKLFPYSGVTDVESWDLAMLTTVSLSVFKQSLSDDEKHYLKSIKLMRDEIYAHTLSSSLSADTYEEIRKELQNALTSLSTGLSTKLKDDCYQIIQECTTGPISPSLDAEFTKQLEDTEHLLQAVMNTLRTQNKFLCDMRKEIMDKLNKMTEDRSEKIIKVIDTKLTLSGAGNKSKDIDFVEGIITTVINKAIKNVGDENDYPRIRTVVHKILKDIENMPDVEVQSAEHKCIILKFRCTTYNGILNLMMYLESRSFLDSLHDLALASSSVLPNVSVQFSLNATVTQECMKELLEELRAKTIEATKYERTIRVPIKVESIQGIEHIWSMFETGGAASRLNELSEAVFDELNTKITVTTSVNLEQVQIAIKEAGEKSAEVAQAAVGDNASSLQRHQIKSVDEDNQSCILYERQAVETRSDSATDSDDMCCGTGDRTASVKGSDVIVQNVGVGLTEEDLRSFHWQKTDIEEKKNNKSAKDKLENWEDEVVKVAVLGRAGTGKSRFINAIRGCTSKTDRLYAKVGPTETTTTVECYTHPNNNKLQLYDIPGIGTQSFPRSTYMTDKRIKFHSYDIYLLMSSERFTQDDEYIAVALEKLGKVFLFVRTRVDISLDGVKDERAEIDAIRADCVKHLTKMRIKSKDVYLISSKDVNHPLLDFGNLVERLVNSLTGLKKEALMLSLQFKTRKFIEDKREFLRKRTLKAGAKSAAGAAVPVPGFSFAVDLYLIFNELDFYRKTLGITDNDLADLSKKTNKDVDELKQEYKLATFDLYKSTTKDGTKSGVQLGSLLAQIAASEAVKTSLKLFLPFIGSAMGAAYSFVTTVCFLRSNLDLMVNDAKTMMDILVKETSDTILSSE